MGRAGSSWEYAVPSFGSDIPTGMKDPKTGGELVRKAGFEDSMLYPLRRLIIATDSCLLNPDPADQTSPFWHGKVPLIPFQMDDWPWEFLGFPLTHDTASMQGSIVNAMRAIDDSANVRLRPPLTYDNRNVSKNFMDRFDPRVPGQTVGMDMLMGELIKPLIPPQYYDVPNWMLEYVKGLEERVDKMMGLNDLVALAKARQVPSADSIEKLMELAGPIVTDMSRGMERSLRDLGEMIKVMFFQFYNTARRIQILGPDGVTEEDWDFEPGNLVPSHMPGEDKASASKTTNIERAKWHANNFVFHVTPNSLHQITQLSRKLLYFQLYKSGFPIDPWTVAEALDLPNFGIRPEGPQTIMGRWIVWLNTQAQLAKEGILPMPPGRGRPASGNKSPQVQQKDGGARSTMATSR